MSGTNGVDFVLLIIGNASFYYRVPLEPQLIVKIYNRFPTEQQTFQKILKFAVKQRWQNISSARTQQVVVRYVNKENQIIFNNSQRALIETNGLHYDPKKMQRMEWDLKKMKLVSGPVLNAEIFCLEEC